MSTQRIASIDAFRGLTVAGMVLVNLPGSWSHLYPAVSHAKWHGWTPTDFVFPFFLFAIGLSMAISFTKRQEQGDASSLLLHIIRRTVILFGFGLFLNLFPKFQWEGLRIPGVLQRIALAYLLAGLCLLWLKRRDLWYVVGGVLLGYWLLMCFVPVPGGSAGVLTPEGNWGAVIDRWLVSGHLYRPTWDPEGLLGTFPAAINVLIGALVGQQLQEDKDKRDIVGELFVMGWILILAGQLWGIWFPINKKLWTSSYVLFSSGAAIESLAFCYWWTDLKGKRWLQPAIIYGSNPIALYVLHILYIKVLRIVIRFPLDEGKSMSLYHWIYLKGFASWAGALKGSLAFAIVHVCLWFVVMWALYRRKYFLKI